MSTGAGPGLLGAIRIDLRYLHETWMELVYPRQRNVQDTVLGKWKPATPRQKLPYYLWFAVGLPVVALIYPLVLLGYFVRFQVRKINVTATRLGLVGVVALFTLLWGGLTLLVYLELSASLEPGAVRALAAASAVAVVAGALAYLFWQVGGRATTVIFAYPFAITAIFLPPVVAALFYQPLGDVIIGEGEDLFRWAFQTGPEAITDPLGERFDRQEHDHAIIWFLASFPVGWALGLVVTLADLMRPSRS